MPSKMLDEITWSLDWINDFTPKLIREILLVHAVIKNKQYKKSIWLTCNEIYKLMCFPCRHPQFRNIYRYQYINSLTDHPYGISNTVLKINACIKHNYLKIKLSLCGHITFYENKTKREINFFFTTSHTIHILRGFCNLRPLPSLAENTIF